MGEKPTVITAEDLELHNEAGGSWTIVSGKVYDLELAEVREHPLLLLLLFTNCLQICLLCFLIVTKYFSDSLLRFYKFCSCLQVLLLLFLEQHIS